MAKTVKITDSAYKKAVEKSGEKSVKAWISEKIVTESNSEDSEVTESNFGSKLDEETVKRVVRDALEDLRIDQRGNIHLD